MFVMTLLLSKSTLGTNFRNLSLARVTINCDVTAQVIDVICTLSERRFNFIFPTQYYYFSFNFGRRTYRACRFPQFRCPMHVNAAAVAVWIITADVPKIKILPRREQLPKRFAITTTHKIYVYTLIKIIILWLGARRVKW